MVSKIGNVQHIKTSPDVEKKHNKDDFSMIVSKKFKDEKKKKNGGELIGVTMPHSLHFATLNKAEGGFSKNEKTSASKDKLAVNDAKFYQQGIANTLAKSEAEKTHKLSNGLNLAIKNTNDNSESIHNESLKRTQGDTGLGKKAQDHTGLGKITQDHTGLGKVTQDHTGLGKITQDDTGLGKKTQDDTGLGKKAQNDAGLGKTTQDDTGLIGPVYTPGDQHFSTNSDNAKNGSLNTSFSNNKPMAPAVVNHVAQNVKSDDTFNINYNFNRWEGKPSASVRVPDTASIDPRIIVSSSDAGTKQILAQHSQLFGGNSTLYFEQPKDGEDKGATNYFQDEEGDE